MNAASSTFGSELRAARQKAGYHTIASLADALSHQGLVCSEDTLSNWERNQRRPSRNDVLPVLSFLAAQGALESVAAVNQLFYLLGLRDLDAVEVSTYFPGLAVAAVPNLPDKPIYDRLVGRDELVNHLLQLITSSESRPVTVISGLGGIGKTALAYEVVKRALANGSFEAVVWETAKSEEFTGIVRSTLRVQNISLVAILLSFAQQLNIDVSDKVTVDDLIYRLKAVLRQRSIIVVLDNLETFDAVRDIARILYELVASSPSRVLLTSRERLADVWFVYDEYLRGLSLEATVELLRLEAIHRGAPTLLEAGDLLLERIFQVTGGMPLAIKLIVSQFMLGISVDRELDRLAAAVDEEELYRFIYFALWEKLSIPAQKVAVGAAAFSTSAQRSMLIEVSEVEELNFDQAAAELVKMCLLEVLYHVEQRRQRYDMHAMTRWFINIPLVGLWYQQQSHSDRA